VLVGVLALAPAVLVACPHFVALAYLAPTHQGREHRRQPRLHVHRLGARAPLSSPRNLFLEVNRQSTRVHQPWKTCTLPRYNHVISYIYQ